MASDESLPFIKGTALKSEKYSAVPRGMATKFVLPPRNAGEHAKFIRDRVALLSETVRTDSPKKITASDRKIISVRMTTAAGVDPERLESTKKGAQISLLDFDPQTGIALVDARPELRPLLQKLDLYEKSLQDKPEAPRNRNLINYIEDIRLAGFSEVIGDALRADWTTLPKDTPIWLEFHVRGGYLNQIEASASQAALRAAFRKQQVQSDLEKLRLQMPEEDVYFALISINAAAEVFALVDCIFELELPPQVALKWLQAEHRPTTVALQLKFDSLSPTAPEVVLLDSGVLGEHPLLKPVISGVHSALENETGADSFGHGTEMAGVAVYGQQLPDVLQHDHYAPEARIRSVQLIKAPGQGTALKEMRAAWPALTEKAVAIADAGAANVKQVFALAITAESKFGDRASSWTNAVDKAAYNQGQGRLILVSIGNQQPDFGPAFVSDFPETLLLQKLDEPAHSFNALTVGAWTGLTELPPKEYDGYTPLAKFGGPSPYSKVGYANSGLSGIKPEVVFEGGNVGVDGKGDASFGQGIPTLSVLTTSTTTVSPFVVRSFWGTSCAAALAAKFAAAIWTQDSSLRPETVRGLIVHAANWTDELKTAFKGRKDDLLCVCGYGIPDFRIASSCVKSRATMIFEDLMEGAKLTDNNKFERSIKFFEVPVPDDLASSNEEVSLRVTLSYLAEPNGFRRKISRGVDLAWRMQGPNESVDEFRARVNGETRKDLKKSGLKRSDTSDFNWDIGPQRRGRGTVQSDRWTGPASFLASKKLIAVYPVNGWWDQRKEFKTKQQRFSLVVTVETEGFDIYTPIRVSVDNLNAAVIEVATV